MRLIRSVRRKIIRNFLLFIPPNVLVNIFLKFVSVGAAKASTTNTSGRIFVLNKDRFRGELEILREAGFDIFTIPFKVQTALIGLFYDTNGKSHDRQKKCFELSNLLYQKLNINITVAVHYRPRLGQC